MIVGPWKVHIGRRAGSLGGDLTIYRFRDRRIEALSISEDGAVISETKEDSVDVVPTMKIAYEEDVRGIIEAFIEAGAEIGLKRPEESFSVGKLEATGAHLEDMRRIVFRGDGSEIDLSAKRPGSI